ncbi:Uncharacterized protein Rs2_40945 [Raphanus sativus]|nr:Uncharacterized protein Rs2_40945 [Raphanus sativus]
MMHAELGCLEIAYFFLTPGTKNSSAACYYSVLEFEQQIKVRAKANSEFSREEVRFRTAHDELLNPSPSESVSVPGIEAKDDSAVGKSHSGINFPHQSKWWRRNP